MRKRSEMWFSVPEELLCDSQQLDPLHDFIDPKTGDVKLTIWRPTNQEWTQFELATNTYASIPSAIRGCKHILANYQNEKKELAEIVELVSKIYDIYLNWDSIRFGEEGDSTYLFQAFSQLQFCLLPEKKKAAEQFFNVGQRKGRDTRGRLNPGAMAAILISGIAELRDYRPQNINSISAFVALRLKLLQVTQATSKEYLKQIAVDVTRILKRNNAWYSTPTRNHNRWYNIQRMEIDRVLAYLPLIWGSPYLELAKRVEEDLKKARWFLHTYRKLQLKAGMHLRSAIAGIELAPKDVDTIKLSLEELRESDEWKIHYLGCSETIGEIIELTERSIDKSIGVPIIECLQTAKKYIDNKISAWEVANTALLHAISRCEW